MAPAIGPTAVIAAVVALLASLVVHVQNDFAPLDIYAPELFSESYYHARALFRAQTQAAGAALFTRALDGFVHLDLTIDFAVLAGASDRVVVHVSGTHGVEGFAGSAIQSALLQRAAHAKRVSDGSNKDSNQASGGDNSHARANAESPTVIFVHALNAFGFSQLRRFNEHNVDLNRNWLSQDEFATRTAADPNAYGYVDVYDVLNPTSIGGAFASYWTKAAYYLATKGFSAIKRATVSGNYRFPTSIFYGGSELQPSLRILRDFLTQHVDLAAVRAFAFIDVHTGLGPAGVDTLIVDSHGDVAHVSQIFGEHERQLHKVVSLRGGEDGVSQGYDGSFGLVVDGVAALLPAASRKNSALVMQEFGTVPGVFILKAVSEENLVYHAAPTQRLPFAEKLRDVFYLHRSASWRAAVVERGVAVFDQLYQHVVTCAST